MRKIIASESMTIDGVIRNEENDGDGFVQHTLRERHMRKL